MQHYDKHGTLRKEVAHTCLNVLYTLHVFKQNIRDDIDAEWHWSPKIGLKVTVPNANRESMTKSTCWRSHIDEKKMCVQLWLSIGNMAFWRSTGKMSNPLATYWLFSQYCPFGILDILLSTCFYVACVENFADHQHYICFRGVAVITSA